MKLARLAITSCAAAALAAAVFDSEAGGRRGGSGHSSSGHHHHGHGHHLRGGFVVFPRTYWWPGYHYPAMVVPVTEPYWYYCAESAAYYPHVQDCPGGWQPVRPASPPPLG